jgi:F0F1-type ATP synthase assembly protein I
MLLDGRSRLSVNVSRLTLSRKRHVLNRSPPLNERYMDRLPADDRSAVAVAWAWASRIIVIAAEMVVPGLLGYYFLDQWLGTRVLFLLIGLALGMMLAILHLVRMTAELNQSKRSFKKNPPQP